jgi:hypothetical protein
MVTMIAPDGTPGSIPQDKVNDAANAGFKLGTDLISPDGKVGTVPVDRVHDALKAGFKLKPTSEADAIAAAPNAAQQAQAAIQQPLKTATGSTIGGIYRALNEGNSSANPKVVAGESLAKNVAESDEAAQQGKITTGGVAEGALKGGLELAHTAGRIANAATGDSVPSLPKSFEQPESLQAANTSESIGKGAEGVLEFIAGDEALKGLTWAQKLQKMSKIAELLEAHPYLKGLAQIGFNSLRQGTVAGAQTLAHTGDVEQAAESAGAAAATGGVLEGVGKGLGAVKNYITRGPAVEELGQKLVEGLTEGATPEQAAKTVAKNLSDAEDAMHTRYDAGLKSISNEGQNVPVKLAGSPLQKTANELLSDSNLPKSMADSLKGVIPDSEKIEPFLTQLSKSTETLSWDEVEATRQKIGQTIRKLPYDSPIRPDLIKLRYAIDDTLQDAADKAGKPDLSDSIKSLRADYAQTNSMLEERAIAALKDKNPNAIADVLLNKQSVHDVNTLRRLIGPDNMQLVEGSVLDKMIQDASKNGQLQGPQLFRKFNSLGPDAKQTIWGDRLPQVQYFMDQAGKLPNPILDKIISHYAPYALGTTAIYALGHGDLKSAGAITAAAGLSALLRNPYVLDAALKSVAVASKVAPPVAAQLPRISEPRTVGDLTSPTPEATHRYNPESRSIEPIQ